MRIGNDDRITGGMRRRRVKMDVTMCLPPQAIGKMRGVKCASVIQWPPQKVKNYLTINIRARISLAGLVRNHPELVPQQTVRECRRAISCNYSNNVIFRGCCRANTK